jgi:hypothetical protein
MRASSAQRVLAPGGVIVILPLVRASSSYPGAGDRRKGRLSALRARTKAPYKIDLHRKTLSALKSRNRPGRARTGE